MMKRRRIGVTAIMLALGFVVVPTTRAAAAPATTVSYPTIASATRLTGSAFDACMAPSLTITEAWKVASPYGGVGVYIGGASRSCSQPNLTPIWVTAVSLQGWRVIPIYVGHQAPCVSRPHAARFSTTTAATLGTADAADAVAQAQALGILPGSAIYGDLEHYSATDVACGAAVLTYVSAWTEELHSRGYLAGMYTNLSSGARHLSEAYGATAYARVDALWIARWDSSTSLTGWAGIPDTQWANHQRAKQYRGDHDETYGEVKINIDSNRFDAPVATAGYAYQITSSTALNGRSGPKITTPITKTYPSGSTVTVVCQTTGARVGTTSVWNKLADGSYVTDYYVSTPSNTTYSVPLPRCTYPFQVATAALNKRSGPGSSYAAAGILPGGALAWVSCQRAGSKVGTTSIWDKLDDGTYVSDHHLATPSTTTYSPPIPRC